MDHPSNPIMPRLSVAESLTKPLIIEAAPVKRREHPVDVDVVRLPQPEAVPQNKNQSGRFNGHHGNDVFGDLIDSPAPFCNPPFWQRRHFIQLSMKRVAQSVRRSSKRRPDLKQRTERIQSNQMKRNAMKLNEMKRRQVIKR